MEGRKGISWLGRKEFYSREGKNFMVGRKGILGCLPRLQRLFTEQTICVAI